MGRYAIFNGLVYGGGTSVIPNPEGTPTEELHSIQIDEDIYEIVGGGGSGEGYSETLLYETTTPFQTGVITLNDDISNYDVLLFRTKFSDETRADLLLQVSLLQDVGYVASPSTSTKHALLLGFGNYYFRVVKGSSTDDNIINIFAASGDQFIYEIYGIKLEGGSGSTDKVTKVYDAVPSGEGCSIVVAEHIWLSDSGGSVSYSTAEYPDITSVDNFVARLTQTAMDDGSRDYDTNITFTFDDTNKTIKMSWGTLSGSSGCYVDIVYSLVEPVVVASDVEVSNTNTVTYDVSSIVPAYQTLASKDFMFNLKHIYSDNDGLGTSSPFNINFNSNTGVLTVSWNDIGTNNVLTGDILLLYKEDGYKLIKDMQPPTETSSGYHGYVPAPKIGDENKFLRGDGTWSEVSGGSQELISYDTTITTTQYGWWTAEDKDGNVLDPDQYELVAVSPIVNNSPSWTGAWDGAFYVNTVDGTTYRYDVTFVNINDGGYIRTSRTWDVKVIYRDKNAAGSGSGSTVVPNPEEEPTDTLNTIEIDGVVYNIEGGSEGGQGLNPANYSTEEEVIGVWTNNLPVYKKTWTFSSAITVGSGSWADTSISVSNTQIHTIVNCEAVGPNGQGWTCISATTDEATQTYVRILNTRDTDVNVKHLTLYYIKNGDSPITPPGTKGEYNYYGGFIDTNNIIQSKIVFHSETSYTATENCVVIWSVANNTSTSMNILIDGVMVAGMYADSIAQPTNFIFLKKNQTITFQPTYSPGESSYTVYGIMYDNEKFIEGEGVEIYSEDEYIVGKWIDGKKLYQKTFIWDENITGSINKSISLDNPDYAFIYSASGVNSENALLPIPYTHSNSSNNIGVFLSSTKNSIGFRLEQTLIKAIITIRYTKTVETDAPAWGGSVTNNYAGFINTNNIIDSGTYTDTFSYIATEDCFVNVAVVMSANNNATITIDGKLVTSGWCASLNTINPILPLKKGQTLVATASASNVSSYIVYGVSYGSGGSSSGTSKIEYSTNEHVVGTWIDGSPVYQRVFTDLNVQTNGTNWVHISSIDTSTWGEIIECHVYRTVNNKMALLPLAEASANVNNINDLAITLASSVFDSVVTRAIVTYTKAAN